MVQRFTEIWRTPSRAFGSLILAGVLAGVVLMTGCNDRKLERFPIVQTFKQEKILKIDILWVLDNSVSMDEENVLVQAGSNAFINALVGSNADFQLGVITMNIQSQEALGNPGFADQSGKLQAPTGTVAMLATANQSATQIINDFNAILNFIQNDPNVSDNVLGKGCEAGIEAARLAVDPAINQNADFVRDDAFLAVIMLTDEDDASINPNTSNDLTLNDGCNDFTKTTFIKSLTTVDEYLNFFNTLKSGNYSVNGIITIPDDATCTSPLEVSTNFADEITKSEGFSASICNSDYSTFLDDLGIKIASLTSKFTLLFPADLATLAVKLNGVELPSTGFSLSADKLSVSLTNPPALGDVIEISYLVDTTGLVLIN